MSFNNLTRITLAVLIVACTATVQTNAMMGRYLAASFGDLCLSAGILSMLVNQKMTLNDQQKMLQRGATFSQLSQLKRDATKIAPYAPILICGGAVLSIAGRISMIEKATDRGLALAGVSIPTNILIILTAYCARVAQAPDAGLLDRGTDMGRNLLNEFRNETGL